MRIALTTRPVAIFGAVFVLALIAFLPMRLVTGTMGLGDAGLNARAVSGSVWRGRLDEARAGALPLGDLRAGLSPLDLLLGRARIGLSAPAGTGAPRGALVVSRHAMGLDVTSATLSTGAVFAPLPVSQVDLGDVVVRFEDGRCARAAGRVRAVMDTSAAGMDFGGAMSGEARCDAGALLLPLVDAAGTDRVSLRIGSDGRYRADLVVQPIDAAAAQKLLTNGFRQTTGGYALTIDGTLRRT